MEIFVKLDHRFGNAIDYLQKVLFPYSQPIVLNGHLARQE